MTDADLIIVGGGIIGLAHARAAARRGLSVLLFDADERPVGASIRNFGHAAITGQIGEFSELARAGREHWLAASAEAGFWSAESGAFVAAQTPAELAVVEDLAASRGADELEVLTGAQLAERVGLARTDHAGGGFMPLDIRVDPREAIWSLTAHLSSLPNVTMRHRTRVLRAEGGRVETAAGEFTANRVLVCVGHRLADMALDLAVETELRECSLAMALVRLPQGWATEGALLTGTSMLRYEAFSSTEAAAGIRADIASRAPELLDIDANLMMASRPDGTLAIGDSHNYATTTVPFVEESTAQILLDGAARLLGVDGFEVLSRWQGVYASSPTRPLIVEDLDAQTTAITVATGLGMTLSFGLAERTLSRLA